MRMSGAGMWIKLGWPEIESYLRASQRLLQAVEEWSAATAYSSLESKRLVAAAAALRDMEAQ